MYAVYGSKAGILHELRDTVLRQPAAEALYEDAMREPKVERKLELFASSIRRRWEFGHDVVAIHRDAGATDPSVRVEVEQVLGMRRNGIARLARSLETELAPGIDVAHAAAILDALTLPEVYAELTDVRGWSADEFEAWLASCLKNQLPRSELRAPVHSKARRFGAPLGWSSARGAVEAGVVAGHLVARERMTEADERPSEP